MPDSERKLNINTADLTSLKGLLMRAAGLKQEDATIVAGSIIDWRDEDNERGQEELINNENVYYELGDLPYLPKNRPYELVEEVALVQDVTPAIYESIAPYITVYGHGKLNINTCSRVLLESLGLDKDLAGKFAAFKERKSSGGGTFLPGVPIVDQFEGVVSLSDKERGLLDAFLAKDLISSDSDSFRIVSIGNLPHRRESLQINCVVDRTGNIRYWQEEFKRL